MTSTPRTGATGQLSFVVEPKHCIDFTSGGMPAVLSTPALIGCLERAAREALDPFLEPGESSVGTEIELRHLAPTPLGGTVICLARVVRAEGGAAAFQIEAREGQEVIARGFHR